MAGDWIKFETSTPDKLEVAAIAMELSIDPDAVVGKLLRIWTWFDLHTQDGNADSVTPSVTKSLLDRHVGVTGFCEAMISVGWMVQSESSVTLPNFVRHNGKTAKTRCLTAKRVADHKKKGNADGNAKVTLDALPREEKRREEKNTTHTHAADDSISKSLPEWLAPSWSRLMDHFFATTGKRVDSIRQETMAMSLLRSGEAKALADIEFTILKGGKSILDSSNDFEKRRQSSKPSSRKTDKNGEEFIF
jgi:hypothetical protein